MWVIAPLFLRARVVLENSKGDILLVKHSFGANQWMLPGGGVKFGERPVSAASREISEELAILVDTSDFLQLHQSAKIWKTRGLLFRVIIFKATLADEATDSIKNSYEIMKMQWFDKDSVEVQKALPRDISL